jgi:hypothetical protein
MSCVEPDSDENKNHDNHQTHYQEQMFSITFWENTN